MPTLRRIYNHETLVLKYKHSLEVWKVRDFSLFQIIPNVIVLTLIQCSVCGENGFGGSEVRQQHEAKCQTMTSCGSCHIVTKDMKKCAECKEVSYCSKACQISHWNVHKVQCAHRKAELEAAKEREDKLFAEVKVAHNDICPVCLEVFRKPVREKSVQEKSVELTCCYQKFCLGCVDGMKNNGVSHCPLCRMDFKQLVELGHSKLLHDATSHRNPKAMVILSDMLLEGSQIGKNLAWARDLVQKAAELNHPEAHYKLGQIYGKDGPLHDEMKSFHHFEEAAILGDLEARFELAFFESARLKTDRAVKHLMIASKAGHLKSLLGLKTYLDKGELTNEQYEESKSGYGAALKGST